jgi:rare lipoprotein A
LNSILQMRRLSPAVSTLTSSLLVLLLAGCHHRQVAVYRPPPPPMQVPDQAQPERATRAANNAPSVRPPVSAEEPEANGYPISSEIGIASWYGPPYTNRRAADGSIYDQNAMTAAHRTLPMGSIVRVTNLNIGESVRVRITVRGPFVDGRIIDLSLAAARGVDI